MFAPHRRRAVRTRRAHRRAGHRPGLERLETRALLATLADPSFEAVPVGPSFRYAPTGSAWTFTAPAAISADGSASTSGNPTPLSGGQVAVLQAGGSFAEAVVAMDAGTDTLSSDAAGRGQVYADLPTQDGDFQVLIDGTVAGTFTPSLTSDRTYTTPLTLAAGTHAITFRGLDSVGGDDTAFLDSVALNTLVS